MAGHLAVSGVQAQLARLRHAGLALDPSAGRSSRVGFAQPDATATSGDAEQRQRSAHAPLVSRLGADEESTATTGSSRPTDATDAADAADAANAATRGTVWRSGLPVAMGWNGYGTSQ